MGKSTLLMVFVALFHNPKSTAKELKVMFPGAHPPVSDCVEFEDEGNGYLLEKDFDKGTVRLIAIIREKSLILSKKSQRKYRTTGNQFRRLFYVLLVFANLR